MSTILKSDNLGPSHNICLFLLSIVNLLLLSNLLDILVYRERFKNLSLYYKIDYLLICDI